jgi:D-alanyl-D-alanine dipeptidase
MAGGEFCGNASRAAALLATGFRTGETRLTVSGFDGEVLARVEKLDEQKFYVSADFLGMKYRIMRKKWDSIPISVVDLGGIVQIVIAADLPKNYEKVQRELTRQFGLENRAAVGVVWCRTNSRTDTVKIKPVVWVKEIDTFFRETSCGSGSIAAALAIGARNITQPTGQNIAVTISSDKITLASEMLVEAKITNKNLWSRRILSLAEVRLVETGRSNESLVDVRKYDKKIIAEPEQPEMFRYTKRKILVRDMVARKLAEANALLGKELNLRVVFGYRHPEIQRQYFERERTKIALNNPSLPDKAIDALTHNLVAVPEIAGHPTGAAIDATLISTRNTTVDMGTKISEFNKIDLLPTYAPNISQKQLANRLKLHDAMAAVGFAPFYGEWWHFSYGDREWAAFYGWPQAIYGDPKQKL